jgi:hypothetical protein
VIACSWPCAFVRAIPKIGAPAREGHLLARTHPERYNDS